MRMALSHIGKLFGLSLVLVIACGAADIKIPLSQQPLTSGRGGRIAGGSEATRNQFPFAVIFFIEAVDEDQSICSGAIISNKYVLSAAHCFSEMYTADLLAGVHNIETESPAYEFTIGPNDVIIHENFENVRNLNDIAIVSVARRPFTFGVSIQAIPIIPRAMANSNLTSVIGRISGWGITNDSRPTEISPVPRYIDAPIISNTACAAVFGSIITSSNLCLSGDNGRSTCTGDSGGGLTIQDGTRRILVGIVSFGSNAGCQRGYPTAFSRVSSFHDWIQRNTGLVIT